MSIRATFHYFQGMECDMYSFYRIPKLLFTSEYFKNLSCEAKVLYGLMLDRMSLSIKNRWFDEEDPGYWGTSTRGEDNVIADWRRIRK